MKIAILTPTFSKFSGIDRVVEQEAKDYAKKGYKVTIFAFKGDIKTKHAEVIYLGAPKNPSLERLYRLFFFLDIPKTRKYTKKLKDFDIVLSHFYPLNCLAYFAKKKYGIKYVYHNAGITFPYLFSGLEKLYMKLFSYFNKLSIKNADEYISISKFLQRELKKDGFNSKVEYCKIDKKRFHKGINGDKIRKKYNLKKNPVLLYVGRISPHKGIHLLLESFNLVLKKVPNAKLLIVGKHTFGSYSKQLKKLSNSSVIFTGFVPDEDVPKYYAASDIYVTATLWEGFDLPAAEAQACGKPVVAFNLCAHPEVVKKGILVKAKDTNAFGEAVVKILKTKIYT